MVQLTIRIRPQRGYTCSGSIKEVQVDSSMRLEELLNSMKSLNKKGTLLYYKGIELPLNSSLATHNVSNGSVLETCSSPILSAVLSAVISDIESVQKLPDEDRSEERMAPLLDYPSSLLHADWNRWSFDRTKTRSICCKMIKKSIQRNERYANHQVPACTSLQELYDFVESAKVFTSQTNNQHNSMAHVFKPSAKNRNGEASLCWVLLQEKLTKYHNQHQSIGDKDKIETFVEAEEKRHLSRVSATPSTPSRGSASRHDTTTSRKRRRLPFSPCLQQKKCTTCSMVDADSICVEIGCPFVNQVCCSSCFRDNHPVLHRNHECVSLQDKRAKAILKQQDRVYCPEYASGPFAILATLYQQQQQNNILSLTEIELKELAQPRCRSNLYDRQARGRSAFACIEKLSDEHYLRKESIPGQPEDRAKYSLLPKGEKIANSCYKFELFVEKIVQNPIMIKDRDFTNATTTKLIIDSREDKIFAERLVTTCQSQRIPFDRKDLPAGDYIFTTTDDSVLPLVIERKTWSDLADSVSGRGRRRLECVRYDANDISCTSKCQLCRMKTSGCSSVLFIIEGARCLNRDRQPTKCTVDKLCKYCQELNERHRLVQNQLETVLYKLCVEHGCYIHFTRDYNDTIVCLLHIRNILSKKIPNLTYDQFCSNARQRNNNVHPLISRGKLVEWSDETFVNHVHKGRMTRLLSGTFGEINNGNKISAAIYADTFEKAAKPSIAARIDTGGQQKKIVDLGRSKDSAVIVLDDDDDVGANLVAFLNRHALGKKDMSNSRGDNDLQVIDRLSAPVSVNKRRRDDICEVIEHLSTPAKKQRSGAQELAFDHVGAIKQSSTSVTTGKKKHARKCGNQDHNELLLLTGMYDYDTDYFKDLNKLWKLAFAEPNHNFEQFLCQLDDSPLVERSYIHYWVLYIQIHFNTIVYLARWKMCAEDLKACWKGGTHKQNISGVRNLITLSKPTNPTPSKPPTPYREKQCVICYQELGCNKIEATPCGHTFHSNCLHKWFLRSRTCPICSYQIGAPKGDNPPPRPPSIRRDLFTAEDDIREARLRRFDKTTSIVARSAPKQTWKCKKCTFENTDNIENCQICSQSRCNNNSSKEQTKTKVSDTQLEVANTLEQDWSNQRWKCTTCTFENTDNIENCQICSQSRCDSNSSKKQIKAKVSDTQLEVANPQEQDWSCSRCTLKNKLTAKYCFACDAPNPFFIDEVVSSSFAAPAPAKICQSGTTNVAIPYVNVSMPTTVNQKSSVASLPKKMFCGACGQQGHNRGNYTATICPKYYDPNEEELRRKKKVKLEEKKRAAQQQIDRLEDAQKSTTDRMVDLQRMIQGLQQTTDTQAEATKSELKRLRDQKKRAEKRAQKYS